ncbi:hypothetical protein [Nonomuraea turkmeniaca]|uniref:hypothetical protein n=1 Tax=Nonomuraea turkmeniaca TaxID=103838 RepID=UPI001B885018|nr:hypothetical protein [Nonomuraea turkmeniaca]
MHTRVLMLRVIPVGRLSLGHAERVMVGDLRCALLALGVIQPLDHGGCSADRGVVLAVAVLGADRFDQGEISDPLERIPPDLGARVEAGCQDQQPQQERFARTGLPADQPVAEDQHGVDDLRAGRDEQRERGEDVHAAALQQWPGRRGHLARGLVADPQREPCRVALGGFSPYLVEREPHRGGQLAAPCDDVSSLYPVGQIDDSQVPGAVPVDLVGGS